MTDFLPSILFYIILFILSALILNVGLLVRNSNKIIGFLLILIGLLLPSVAAGIRYNVGADYVPYLKMYENALNGRPLYFREIEPLSALVIIISSRLGSSSLMFFLFNFITNLCFFISFLHLFKNDKKKVALGYFFYLCILFSTTLNAVRSGVSISLTFLSFCFLFKRINRKNVFISLLCALLAFLFHRSAVLFLLFLPAFIYSKKHAGKNIVAKKVCLWLIYLIIMLFLPLTYSFWGPLLLSDDYSRYLRGFGDNFSVPIADIVMSLFMIWSAIYLTNRKSSNREIGELLYCSSFYIPLSIAVGWFTYSEGLSRMSFVLLPLVIAVMAHLASLQKRKANVMDLITTFLIIAVVFVMFVRNLNWSVALPYKTIYQPEISYALKN